MQQIVKNKSAIYHIFSLFIYIANYYFTAADTDMENMQRTVECLRGLAFCLDGAIEKVIIYGLEFHEKGEIKYKTDIMKRSYNMGINV